MVLKCIPELNGRGDENQDDGYYYSVADTKGDLPSAFGATVYASHDKMYRKCPIHKSINQYLG